MHGRPGREDRSGRAAAPPEYSLLRAARLRTSCRRTSRAGTSACCRSRATRRRDSSARPRRSSTWRPDKPIVSTPITDVAEPYGDIVHLGDTPRSSSRPASSALALAERRARRERHGSMRDGADAKHVMGRDGAAAMDEQIGKRARSGSPARQRVPPERASGPQRHRASAPVRPV